MKSTKINSGKREGVTQDLQGVGSQEADMMNQLPSKNRPDNGDDVKVADGKTGADKGKQQHKTQDSKSGQK